MITPRTINAYKANTLFSYFELSKASASQCLLYHVLTCFRELLLLALPFSNGDVINGDVTLKPITTDALKHHLEIKNPSEGDSKLQSL